jgi:hypothetical protein
VLELGWRTERREARLEIGDRRLRKIEIGVVREEAPIDSAPLQSIESRG